MRKGSAEQKAKQACEVMKGKKEKEKEASESWQKSGGKE